MLWIAALAVVPASAQITRVSGTVSDEFGELPGVNIQEVDGNQRIVSATVSDGNGNFSMTIKSAKNALIFKMVGYKAQTIKPITKATYKINMSENVITKKEVSVVGKKKAPTTGLEIP